MNKAVFKLLVDPLKQRPKVFLIAIATLLVATAAEVAGPFLVKIFIDDYLVPGNFASHLIAMLATVYVATVIISGIGSYIQFRLFSGLALRIIADLRKKVFAHVLSLPMRWHDTSISGQTLSRITNDTESLLELYVSFLSSILTGFVLIIGILIGMALLDIELMLVALAMIPAVVILVYVYQKFSGKAVADVRARRAEQNVHVSEAINGMSVLQAMHQTQRYGDAFSKVNEGQYDARMRIIRTSGLFLRPAMDMISTTVLATMILVFGFDVIGGVAEVGVLYAFVMYLGRFSEPLIEITQRFSLFQTAMVAGERVYNLLQQTAEDEGTDEQPIKDASITIHQLNFAYKADRKVLHNIDVDIPQGKFIGLVGRTGSGKSTLLNLLLGHYPVEPGQIVIDGRPLNSLSEANRTKSIGLIPQEPFIKVGTLRDNLVMDRDISEASLQKAIDQAQLRPLVNQLANGLDTELGEGGSDLSTGQRQLIAMARALAAEPKVLLLDEATASLDSQTEMLIQQALDTIKGEVTLIVVAHRLSTIRQADEIILLADGHIAERGRHAELLAIPDGRYGKLYQYQQEEVALQA